MLDPDPPDPGEPDPDPLVTRPSEPRRRGDGPPPSPLWSTAADARRRADGALAALLARARAGGSAHPGH